MLVKVNAHPESRAQVLFLAYGKPVVAFDSA